MSTVEMVQWALGTFVGMLILYTVMAPIRRPKWVGLPKEAAAVPAVPEEKPVVYGKAELSRDLSDPSLTIEQVMDRCRGMDPEDIKEVAADVGKPHKGGRKAERLAWYAQMLTRNKTLKVVPAPKTAPVVLALKGSMEVCKMCVDQRRLAPKGVHIRCDTCRGNGFVLIQRG